MERAETGGGGDENRGREVQENIPRDLDRINPIRERCAVVMGA